MLVCFRQERREDHPPRIDVTKGDKMVLGCFRSANFSEITVDRRVVEERRERKRRG